MQTGIDPNPLCCDIDQRSCRGDWPLKWLIFHSLNHNCGLTQIDSRKRCDLSWSHPTFHWIMMMLLIDIDDDAWYWWWWWWWWWWCCCCWGKVIFAAVGFAPVATLPATLGEQLWGSRDWLDLGDIQQIFWTTNGQTVDVEKRLFIDTFMFDGIYVYNK